MQTCSQCNNVLEDGVKFCDKCGASLQQAAPAPAAEPVEEPAAPAEKKDIASEIQKQLPVKLSKNALIGVLAGAIVVLIILAALIFGGGGTPNFILYTSDGHTFYAEGSSYKPQQLGDELTMVQINEDADKYLMKDEDGDLYYYELGDEEALKLDSEAYDIYVNEDFDLVTYRKGDVIYQHDLDEKEKIASDVDDIVAVSEDGKIIYYYEEAQSSESEDDDEDEPVRTLYVKKGSKEAEKIGEIEDVAMVTEDLETIYYKDDDALFRKTIGKEKEKLASGILELYNVSEEGTAYYAKGEEDEENDETEVTFCYFDGKKEIALGEKMTLEYYGGLCAPERDVAIFRGMEPDEEDPVYWVAVEDTLTVVEEDLDRLAAIDAEGSKLYYFVDVNDENEGDLYCIEIGSKPGKGEKVDSEVSTYDVSILGEDTLVYFKDISEEHGEMYVNGKAADVDVFAESLIYHEDEDLILYFTDYNEEKNQGTLRIFDGKAESIMDDVYRAYFTPDGDVVFLVDYNTEKGRGELYVWTGSKPKKIADDVNRIYNTYSIAQRFAEK